MGSIGSVESLNSKTTMSLPMCRLRASCCESDSLYGSIVLTWNMSSRPWYDKYTDSVPVLFAARTSDA